MKYPSLQNAFTLVETIVVVAVSVALCTALGILIFNLSKISDYQQAVLESSGSASALMKDIGYFALPAHAVVQSHTFSTATRTSTSTALVLEIPSIDASGNTIAGAYDYAAFYVIGTEAYRELETHALSARIPGTKKLSSTVHTLSFSYDAANVTQTTTITVDLQMQTQIKQETIYDHRQQSLRLRNY